MTTKKGVKAIDRIKDKERRRRLLEDAYDDPTGMKLEDFKDAIDEL